MTSLGCCWNTVGITDPLDAPTRFASLSLACSHRCAQLHLPIMKASTVRSTTMQERKIFDEKFIRLDTRRLCELTSAADSLDMKPLVDLSSRALARMIEGKTPEEIRESFHLPDDLTEEEKLEPVKNATDDPRIRLLNRLYAKKRKVCCRDLPSKQQQVGTTRLFKS